MMKLNKVYDITATADPGVYHVNCNITDFAGETADGVHAVSGDDPHGLSPVVWQWMLDNSDFPIAPYVPPAPPTAEGIRAAMPSLTARQLRLGLLDAGIPPAQVSAAINAMPAGADRDRAMIEWEYANSFARLHALLPVIGAAIGLSEEQIDEMWASALTL